jgi:putative nucleotidyltransferase with HDIG domain
MEARVQDTKELTETLLRLPAQPVAAMRVLKLVEDPNASAAELARLIETDPALSARVIRLANSPYYGLARRVSSASRAVVLLGFSTVRALAVSAACSLLVEEGRLGPRGYWPHSVATAAAASVVARYLRGPVSEAFSAGLLHDLGAALLYRQDPGLYALVTREAGDDGTGLLEAEERHFGTSHPHAAAAVMAEWRFPEEFVLAVSSHHDDPHALPMGLPRIVVAGDAVAGALEQGLVEPAADLEDALAAAGLGSIPPKRVVNEARREIATLAAFLGVER